MGKYEPRFARKKTDEQGEKPAGRGHIRKKDLVYYGVIVVLVLVFLVSAIYLIQYFVKSRQQQGDYDELSNIRDQHLATAGETYPMPKPSLPSLTDPTATTVPPNTDYLLPENPEEMEILPEYQDLYEMNHDLVGWISIPGTKVNYPVVQTGTDNRDYYLHRDFYKQYSERGAIYAREECDPFKPSDNVVLYGHHMKDGTMFAQISKYKTKEFWQENQFLVFDSLYRRHLYQVVAVFKTSADLGKGFAYHQFNDAANEEEFNEFWATVQRLSFYDTGIEVHYGDKLVTLSTCEYTLNNGRFVVIAKRIS